MHSSELMIFLVSIIAILLAIIGILSIYLCRKKNKYSDYGVVSQNLPDELLKQANTSQFVKSKSSPVTIV
jgi:hypothetical protein